MATKERHAAIRIIEIVYRVTVCVMGQAVDGSRSYISIYIYIPVDNISTWMVTIEKCLYHTVFSLCEWRLAAAQFVR